MKEIKPNQWYTIGEAFGIGSPPQSLYDEFKQHNRFTVKEDKFNRALRIMKYFGGNAEALFKGSTFDMSLDFESQNPNDLTKTLDGEPIYYPREMPTKFDLKKRFRDKPGITYNYAKAEFYISTSLEEDMLNGLYKFRIVLKTPNAILISNPEVNYNVDLVNGHLVFINPDDTPAVVYEKFYPFDFKIRYEKRGKLYLPLDPSEVSKLEIMLFDNLDKIRA